jgi:hypothetical protein
VATDSKPMAPPLQPGNQLIFIVKFMSCFFIALSPRLWLLIVAVAIATATAFCLLLTFSGPGQAMLAVVVGMGVICFIEIERQYYPVWLRWITGNQGPS